MCGINSVLEKMEAGQNESCRVFSVVDAKYVSFVSVYDEKVNFLLIG